MARLIRSRYSFLSYEFALLHFIIAAFCADSGYLVTASSDATARLWNLRTGDVVRQYHGHQSAVTCVALNDSSV